MKLIEKIFLEILFKIKSKKYIPLPINKLDKNNNYKFLVISNTALGDTLLSLPAIKSLKLSFPYSKIYFVTKKELIPLFKNLDYIDELIGFNGNYRHIFKTYKKIKKISPDYTFIFHSNSPIDIKLCVISNCNPILKHPTKTYLKKYISYSPEFENIHNIEEKLKLIKQIGAQKLTTRMEINIPNNDKFKKYKNFIGFQIGAADKYKMWPIENFIKLGELLIQNGEKIVITGIQKEFKLAEKLVKALPKGNVINMCGKTSIEELGCLLKNLKMLITNDTGTMHLAIALNTPTISLFSPTNSQGIGPYQDLHIHKVIQKDGSYIQKLPKKLRDDSAMKLIKVEEVYQTYKELNEILSL